MKVLQLIDSLRPGGAEKMAVNIANALIGKVEASYLCCSRFEGILKEEVNGGVGYIFINKKHSLDLKAFWKLREFIQNEQIDLVHVHGTSWFWGVLLKLSGLKVKLVWHDHYGESQQLAQRDVNVLKPLSRHFDGIISVNTDLKKWAEDKLKFRPVIHLNNFITKTNRDDSAINLKGTPTDFKIICVANLRPQKDHLNLIEAFEISAATYPNLTLHLVGEDPVSSYSKKVLDKISSSRVANKIYFYGSQKNISGLLKQANLGVLASRSEGMPLVLLEYGMAGLPVISTRVGQCSEVLGNEGVLVTPNNPLELSNEILNLAEDKELSLDLGKRLKKRLKARFDVNSFRVDLLMFYKKI